MARKLKVLCFHPALAPYRVDYFNLLAELTDLTVVFHQDNLQNQKFDQNRLLAQVHFKYCFDTVGVNWRGRILRIQAERMLRLEQPDVVISYESSPNVLELIIRRKFFGASWKLWTSMDDNADQVWARTGSRKVLRNYVLRHVDGVITPSKEAGEAIRNVCMSKGVNPQICVVPIIHDDRIMKVVAKDVLQAGLLWRRQTIPVSWKTVLLFVGRLAHVKNLSWLIEQMKNIRQEIGLVLVGDGEEYFRLVDRVNSLGLSERVLFVGRREGLDVYSIMSAVDGLVLCSHHETYGAVVAEALQWGTPCLVADSCGARCLIQDGRNGCVFKYNDTVEFQRAVKEICQRNKSGTSLLPVKLNDAVKALAALLYET